MLAFNLVLGMLAPFISMTIAQSTSVEPSQSTLISAALASYESSLLHGPVATSLAVAVAFDIPSSELPSLASNIESLVPLPTTDQYSYATAPPITDLQTPGWATTLPTQVQSELLSLETSVILAQASIVRSILSITATPSVETAAAAAATSSTGSSGAGSMKLSVTDGTLLGLLASGWMIWIQ